MLALVKNGKCPGDAWTASRNHFSSGSLGESSGGEHQIFKMSGAGGVLKNDDLKASFCD
jgi:hypothetical protein